MSFIEIKKGIYKCIRCKKDKPHDQYKRLIYVNGFNREIYLCKDCTKETQKIYNNSDRGKDSMRKSNAKRRTMGHNPLNKRFPGSEGHHINSDDIIYIPKELHRSIAHNHNIPDSMIEINRLAYEWLN